VETDQRVITRDNHAKCRLILIGLAQNLMYKQTTVKVSNINAYEAPFTGFPSSYIQSLPINWQTGNKKLIMDFFTFM
jgi:hypothetical protein